MSPKDRLDAGDVLLQETSQPYQITSCRRPCQLGQNSVQISVERPRYSLRDPDPLDLRRHPGLVREEQILAELLPRMPTGAYDLPVLPGNEARQGYHVPGQIHQPDGGTHLQPEDPSPLPTELACSTSWTASGMLMK